MSETVVLAEGKLEVHRAPGDQRLRGKARDVSLTGIQAGLLA